MRTLAAGDLTLVQNGDAVHDHGGTAEAHAEMKLAGSVSAKATVVAAILVFQHKAAECATGVEAETNLADHIGVQIIVIRENLFEYVHSLVAFDCNKAAVLNRQLNRVFDDAETGEENATVDINNVVCRPFDSTSGHSNILGGGNRAKLVVSVDLQIWLAVLDLAGDVGAVGSRDNAVFITVNDLCNLHVGVTQLL